VTLAPRAVVVHRHTELDELLARHGTRPQAAFFLSSRRRSLEEAEARHARQQAALATVSAAIPIEWRRGQVERADLDRFLYARDDVIIVIGQDGLVANVAKYLDGQPVIGINPEPERNPGVLVPHPAEAAPALLAGVASPSLGEHVQVRTMVEASTDDGQTLLALNEVFIGHSSHQSARYRLELPEGGNERQSSSGLLVSTGTGATGWCRSVWQERHSAIRLPEPEDDDLVWFVREAWPSPATGTDCTEGVLRVGEELSLVAESDRLVLFGDGIETDAVPVTWGQRVTVSRASSHLHLVV